MTRPDRSPSPRPFPRRDPAGMERLRDRVRALEGWGTDGDTRHGAVLSLGVSAIDTRLPWGGLPRGALHEVFAAGPGDAGAATGFCAALAALLLRDDAISQGGTVLWCEGGHRLDAGDLYAPGLARFGIAPERLIAVRARTDADALWAMEEGLRAGRLAAVVGEIADITPTRTRRLQLAAEEHGTAALLLRPRSPKPAPSAALTRWRIAARPSVEDGTDAEPACWRAELFRCRGGGGDTWEVEWCDETGGFTVAAAVRDRPAVPDAPRLAG